VPPGAAQGSLHPAAVVTSRTAAGGASSVLLCAVALAGHDAAPADKLLDPPKLCGATAAPVGAPLQVRSDAKVAWRLVVL
jgi:hypothetical protein